MLLVIGELHVSFISSFLNDTYCEDTLYRLQPPIWGIFAFNYIFP
nr:MAG TPA: hypothetical protein [Caudoviricetes sp.]